MHVVFWHALVLCADCSRHSGTSMAKADLSDVRVGNVVAMYKQIQ